MFATSKYSARYSRRIPRPSSITSTTSSVNEEKSYDAVQEAFMKLWENCAKVAPEKAKSYVYTVANNLYLNVIKAEKVRLKYADKSLKTTQENPEFLLEEQQFKEKLDRALNALPKISASPSYCTG